MLTMMLIRSHDALIENCRFRVVDDTEGGFEGEDRDKKGEEETMKR